MPNVAHIGSKFFAHRMDYPSRKFPLAEPGFTQEIDYPYRTGKSLVMRLPFSTHAVCVGVWVGQEAEDEALTRAIGARWIGEDDVSPEA